MDCEDDVRTGAADQSTSTNNNSSPGSLQFHSPAAPPSTLQLAPEHPPTVSTTETPSQRVRRQAAREQENRQTARIESLRRSPLPPEAQENKVSSRAQMRRSTRLARAPQTQPESANSASTAVPVPAPAPAPAPASPPRPSPAASTEPTQARHATEALQSSNSASMKTETLVEQALRKARENQERRRRSQSKAVQPAPSAIPTIAANQSPQHNRTQVKRGEGDVQEDRAHGSGKREAMRNASARRSRPGQARAEQSVAVWNGKVKNERNDEPPRAKVKIEQGTNGPARSSRASSSHANAEVPAQNQRDVQGLMGPLTQGQGTAASPPVVQADLEPRHAPRSWRSAIAKSQQEQILEETQAASQSANQGSVPPVQRTVAQEQPSAKQPPRESVIERAQRLAREKSGRRNAK